MMRSGPMVSIYLRKSFFVIPFAIDPLHPLVGAAGIDANIAASPAQLQRLADPGAAEMGHDECDFGEILGDIVQFQRIDVFVPGDATATALYAEMDQYRNIQLGAHSPNTG